MNKITVALLDDDILARNTIKELLEGSKYEVIKESSEPDEFLIWVKENEINILLCDMKMPKLNGIELIEKLRVTHKYLPIIAISSFDDFEFVRGCMKYDVEDYLLKSDLCKKSIINVLNGVSEKNQIVERINYNKTNIFDLNEVIDQEALIKRSNITFNRYSVSPFVFILDYPILETKNWKNYREENYKALIDIINQVLGNNYPYVLQKENNFIISIYLSFSKEHSISSIIKKIEKSFCEKIKRKVGRLIDLTLFILIDDNASFDECYSRRELRIKMSKDKLYLLPGSTIDLKDIQEQVIGGYVFKEQVLPILNFALELGYNELLIDVMNFLFTEMVAKKIDREQLKLSTKKLLQNINYSFIDLIVPQISDIDSLKRFIGDKYIASLREQEALLKGKYSPSINQLMSYIQRNYSKDYSLEEYSDNIGVSYTHLSRIFKKETGMRFSEYANLIKINRAKLLLLEGVDSIKSIAEQTGFKGYNYFFKVFKDTEGLPPAEFIAKNCSN
jgi:YesN/AraC family two-component response regulator